MPNHAFYVPKDGALNIHLDDRMWYLDFKGRRIYLLGVACDTCEAIFSRMHDLDLPLVPQVFSAMLARGINAVSDDIVQTVRPLLPRGFYMVGLIETTPIHIPAEAQACNAEPCPDYYWWQKHQYPGHKYTYELIVPCAAEQSLDLQRVAWYRAAMERGERPTVLALSMLDHRRPGGRHSEWTLVHFLLDGHHKVMAASQLGVPITLLSFFRKGFPAGTSEYEDPLVYEHYETHARR